MIELMQVHGFFYIIIPEKSAVILLLGNSDGMIQSIFVYDIVSFVYFSWITNK